MGRREGRRRPTRKEKIARSKKQKAVGAQFIAPAKELPPLSVDGKEVAGGVAAADVIEKIRRT